MTNIEPINQTKLFGLDKFIIELIHLEEKKKLPPKILLSGQKGLGKSTLAYHLINYILSKNEKYSYDINTFQINPKSNIFKTVLNKSNPNLIVIDVLSEKKTIDINQIRDVILKLNKSSFNEKPRFVLIDNIEYLNINSINALLKTLEESVKNTFFILINNNTKILPTLKSRCINFNFFLSNKDTIGISNKLLGSNIYDLFNEDLLDYYISPGKIYKLYTLSKSHRIDFRKLSLKDFLILLIDETYYKKDNLIRSVMYDFIEIFLLKKISNVYNNHYRYFLKKIDNTKKYNLDEGSLFLEIDSKLLNG